MPVLDATSSAPLERGVERRLLLCIFLSLCIGAVVIAATRLAFLTYGAPFPGLMLDPYGSFSTVRLPSWPTAEPLKFPAQLVAIDGRLEAPSEEMPNSLRLRQIRRDFAERYVLGEREVALTFLVNGEMMTTTRALRVTGVDEVVFFFLFYVLVGCSIFGSGVIVYMMAKRREAARAYALWALGMALFFCTFYDYHSTAALTPLFSVGSICTLAGFWWLAWTFPSPPRQHRRLLRNALVALSVLAAAVAAILVASPWLGFDATQVRIAVSLSVSLSLFALVGSIAIRLRSSSGEERQELRTAAHGLITVPAILGVGFLMAYISGESAVHLYLPLLAPAIPLAIGYTIVRHDTLHTSALLNRWLVLAVLVLMGLAVGVLGWFTFRLISSSGMAWIASLTFGLLAFLLTVGVGHRFLLHSVFPAMREYRPTIDQLSARLGMLRDEASIRTELEKLIGRGVTSNDAAVMGLEELAAMPNFHASITVTLQAGRHVRLNDANHRTTLLIPMRLDGELCGVFRVGPKVGGALFTSEDIALLETMAALGALALRHAAMLREVDDLRRAQVDAYRDERTRVVDSLSAEIAHELGHPLRYFRDLFQERSLESPLCEQEVIFARLQLERMDRLLATLETLEIPPPCLAPVVLRRPIEHAILLLREWVQVSGIHVHNDVPDDVIVQAEHDPLVQVFANLLRNAAQAAGARGSIGVRTRREPEALLIDVWDSGPGISREVQADLFRVWGVTTRRGGKGLGLVVTTRILGHLHWRIDFLREQNETVFRIAIPC